MPPTIAHSGASTPHREARHENHAPPALSESRRLYTQNPMGSDPGSHEPVIQDKPAKALSMRTALVSPPDSTGWRSAVTRCNRKPPVAGDGAGRSASAN